MGRDSMYRRVGRVLIKVWPMALAVVFVAGVAVASIPDSQGVIHGCYVTSGGRLRVIDSGKGQKCRPAETSLNWNITGPQGKPGPQGQPGLQGPPGASATEAQFSSGGVACATSTDFFPNDRCELNPADGSLNVDAVYVDPSNYPGSATYYIDWVLLATGVNQQVCGRLYDYTAGAPVAGTARCWTRTGAQLWSDPIPTANFSLAAGRHEYAAQVSTNPTDNDIGSSFCCSDGKFTLVIDW
jgi:hypothetical protein